MTPAQEAYLRNRGETGRPWTSRVIWLLILLGIPLIFWAGCELGSSSYRFWKHGIAKRALVISLDHADYVYKGGLTYWYRIDIEGREITAPFRVRLPEGVYVPILVLPEEMDAPAIGSKTSSLFDIYAYSVGGKVMGALSIVMFVFFTCYSPMLLRQIWRKRRIFFAY
jgi:hypothetical protein